MIDNATLGSATAFLAGMVSFLSPCVLPLVPGYLSYVAGHSVHGAAQPADPRPSVAVLALGLLFVLGFSTVFIALGASATALGQWLLRYRYEANIVGGAIVAGFGLFMLGLMRHVSWFHRDLRFHPHVRGGRPVAAYVLGLAFGFGWTPCIGPVLGAILTVTAVSAAPGDGIALLAVYSAGLGVPFLLAAAFTGGLVKHLRTLRHIGRPLQVAAGLVLVAVGVAMMTGQLSAFALWLLRTFPVLGTIG
jgi:cytochrome c-type biogenesis protein